MTKENKKVIPAVSVIKAAKDMQTFFNSIIAGGAIITGLFLILESVNGESYDAYIYPALSATAFSCIAALLSALIYHILSRKEKDYLINTMLSNMLSYVRSVFKEEDRQHEVMSMACLLMEKMLPEEEIESLIRLTDTGKNAEKRKENGKLLLLTVIKKFKERKKAGILNAGYELTPEGEKVCDKILEDILKLN